MKRQWPNAQKLTAPSIQCRLVLSPDNVRLSLLLGQLLLLLLSAANPTTLHLVLELRLITVAAGLVPRPPPFEPNCYVATTMCSDATNVITANTERFRYRTSSLVPSSRPLLLVVLTLAAHVVPHTFPYTNLPLKHMFCSI